MFNLKVGSIIVPYVPVDIPPVWTVSSGTPPDLMITTLSKDGSTIVGVSNSGTYGVNYSHDFGATWNTNYDIGVVPFRGVAASFDGRVIFLVSNNIADVYVSTNYGVTFNTVTVAVIGLKLYRHCSVSRDGTILFAVLYGGGTIVSTDSGATFTYRGYTAPDGISDPYHEGCCISEADNALWFTSSTANARIRKSIDYGVSWQTMYAPGVPLYCIDATADAQTILAGGSSGTLIISRDAGISWTAISTHGLSDHIYTCSISDDGMVMVITSNNNGYKYSVDSGTTWTSIPLATGNSWYSGGLSATGKRGVISRYAVGIPIILLSDLII